MVRHVRFSADMRLVRDRGEYRESIYRGVYQYQAGYIGMNRVMTGLPRDNWLHW